jgi:hypothetical protein
MPCPIRPGRPPWTLLRSPSGSQVTGLLGTAAAPHLVTVQGVEPGDVLTMVDSAFENAAGPSAPAHVTISGVPAFGTSFHVQAGSGGGSFSAVPATLNLYPAGGGSQGCASAGNFPLLAFGYASDAGALLGFTFAKNNLLPPIGGTAQAALAGPWVTGGTTQTIALTNPLQGGFGSHLAFNDTGQDIHERMWR